MEMHYFTRIGVEQTTENARACALTGTKVLNTKKAGKAE
jgi:hypothetical protein